jgi:streptomycin 6-kinase
MRRMSSGHSATRLPGPVPDLDDVLRARLRRRFGASVETWLDELPPVLRDLGERWQLSFDSVIQRGSMSVVVRCRVGDGRPAVLKVSPDRPRVKNEAASLSHWETCHVPGVLAVDEDVGALLIEAIQPGASLEESGRYPSLAAVADLMGSLHLPATPDTGYSPVLERIAYLFDAGIGNYDRRPDLDAVIPRGLYERGHRMAARLATEPVTAVVLHGDLTPSNILDGGPERGLVAIDPAPCLGDSAFDAVDLVLWQAENADTITTRATQLAATLGVDAHRLVQWSAAFAAMNALEIAEASDDHPRRVQVLTSFATAWT